MLAQTLQVFQSDHLVVRHAHAVVPQRVDHPPTPLGAEIATRVLTLACWIEDNLADLLATIPA